MSKSHSEEMASNYNEPYAMLLVLALEGSYYDSVSQGSCTGEKGIIFQNRGEHICQFYGRLFEGEDVEEIDGLAIFRVSM